VHGVLDGSGPISLLFRRDASEAVGVAHRKVRLNVAVTKLHELLLAAEGGCQNVGHFVHHIGVSRAPNRQIAAHREHRGRLCAGYGGKATASRNRLAISSA